MDCVIPYTNDILLQTILVHELRVHLWNAQPRPHPYGFFSLFQALTFKRPNVPASAAAKLAKANNQLGGRDNRSEL